MPTLDKSRIPNSTSTMIKCIRDSNTSWKAGGIYSYLACLPNGFKFTAKDLIKASPSGEKALRSGIHELERRHYLQITRRKPIGPSQWILLDRQKG